MATVNSGFNTLSAMEGAYTVLNGGFALTSALTFGQAAYDNANFLPVGSYFTLTNSQVSGVFTNGDYFTLTGSNLLAIPYTSTRLDYVFSSQGVSVSEYGSITNNGFSDSGYINKVVVSHPTYGSITINGFDNVALIGDGTISSVVWDVGGARFTASGSLAATVTVGADGFYHASVSGTYTSFTVVQGLQTTTISGASFNSNLQFSSAAEFLALVLSGNDLVSGTAAAEELYGFAGSDSLSGGDGNDTLLGGAGSDTLNGGAGDDAYIVDSGDFLVDVSGSDNVFSDFSYALPAGLERLYLLGTGAINAVGNSLNNTLVGNSGDNLLYGDAGADSMIGGGGNDSYIIDHSGDMVSELIGEGLDVVQASVSYSLTDHVERLRLVGTQSIAGSGNGIDNQISGNSGGNTLNGGAGADIISGGPGDDIYVIDQFGDQVMELADSGFDAVVSAISYDLMSAWHVENLTLSGSGNLSGTGNWFNNLMTGNAGNNVLDGSRGNDTLDGGAGSDTLKGGDGDDWMIWDPADGSLQGGAGLDRMVINGSGVTVDLTAVSDLKIVDAEIIDVTGSGNNALTLALADVLAISSSSDLLRIDGNVGDTVSITASGGWSAGSDQVIGLNTYRTYTQGVATLLVDADMTTVLLA